nr:metal ABC transporter permease [Flavimobilis soli]
MGVVFTSLFALGLVLVSVTPSQVDLSHILFGNVLGVAPPTSPRSPRSARSSSSCSSPSARPHVVRVRPCARHAIGLSPRGSERCCSACSP